MRDVQKTLVILTPAFPADESETSWVAPKQLFIKKLKANFPELNIIILTFLYPQKTDPYYWNGITVIPFNGMKARKFRRLVVWMRVWKALSRIRRQHNVIGLFSFWCTECALVGRYFARRKRLKHFCWISGMDARKENKLVKWIRPRPSELVAMSEFLVDEFEKNHSIQPQHVIPIGTDPSEFGQPPFTRDIDVLGAGSFSKMKKYSIFIRVIKEMTVKFPHIRSVLCGKGEEQEIVEGLVSELALERNITLAGMLPKEEVLQYMQRARIFLHPSAYEGFGSVCIEALQAGAHVISFCNPMKLKIPHWHIVQSQEEMVEKTRELLSAPHLDHTPVMLYSMDETAKAVMKLFDSPLQQ